MDDTLLGDALTRARRQGMADLAWRTGDAVEARGVLPLHDPREPDELVVALTYAESLDASSLAAAGRASLVLDAPEGTAGRTALTCAVRVEADPEGEVFVDRLLDPELRRWPPSRLLADSPLLRREHWWYLPRLLVRLRPETVTAVPGPLDSPHLLVVGADHGLTCAAITTPRSLTTADRGPVRLDDVQLDAGGPAVLHGRAVSPDRERWSQWSWHGQWDGRSLDVVDARGRVGPAPVPGVLQRWRAQRRLERACRDGLTAHGSHGSQGAR